jgi:hypothetical protein
MAERLLTPVNHIFPATNGSLVSRIEEALSALNNGDRAHAIQVVDPALTD